MIAIIQRCTKANVKINNKIVSEIASGMVVLLGIRKGDEKNDVQHVANKIIALRIFPDQNNKMNLSIKDINGSILVVSQFTLCASTKKGNRPSFLNAAPPLIGRDLYKNFILHLKSFGVPVSTGKFGAMMDVYLINQGPATFIIDSKT